MQVAPRQKAGRRTGAYALLSPGTLKGRGGGLGSGGRPIPSLWWLPGRLLEVESCLPTYADSTTSTLTVSMSSSWETSSPGDSTPHCAGVAPQNCWIYLQTRAATLAGDRLDRDALLQQRRAPGGEDRISRACRLRRRPSSLPRNLPLPLGATRLSIPTSPNGQKTLVRSAATCLVSP